MDEVGEGGVSRDAVISRERPAVSVVILRNS